MLMLHSVRRDRMVTTVVGQLKEGVTPFDAVSQSFPPGEPHRVMRRIDA